MSRILIGLEAPGREQIYDAHVIGSAFAAQGHEVLYVVPDPVGFAGLGEVARTMVLPAAGMPKMPDLIHRPPAIGSLIDWFVVNGMAEAGHLITLTRIWTQQLQMMAPALIVAMGAPTLWLAGPAVAPTMIVGDGAALPPIVEDSFPRFSADIPPAIAHNILLDNINAALAEIGLPAIERFAELIDRCTALLYGLRQFDPYLPLREQTSLGMLGQWPDRGQRPLKSRLSIFLDAYCPNVEAILVALGGLQDVSADLFVKGITPSMRGFLQSLPAVKLWDRFEAARQQVPQATAVVHHGIGLLATDAMVLGKPQLMLPWTQDQKFLLDKLDPLGVTWQKDPQSPINILASTLRDLPNAAAPFAAANHHANQLAGKGVKNALTGIIASAESILHPPTTPSARIVEAPLAAVPSAAKAADEPDTAAAAEASPDSFCALPWQHLCVSTEGTARICCMTADFVSENDSPMSLYTHSLDEIWNSAYMRQVRRDMAAGKRLKQCEVCYQAEAASGESYRTGVGLLPLPDKPLTRTTVASDLNDDFRVEAPPGFVKLELGNLCNLKCRMCYGGASSEVERDPVHTWWNGGAAALHAVWLADRAVVGPFALIGVAQSGLHPQAEQDLSWRWSDGRAVFDIPLHGGTKLLGIDIDFEAGQAPGHMYFVRVNKKTKARGKLDPNVPRISIDIADMDLGKQVVIEIESGTLKKPGDKRQLGLPIAAVALRREPVAQADAQPVQVLGSPSGAGGPWYKSDDLMFNQLLGQASNLQRLYVTGGEPLIEPRFADIVRHLVDKGMAGNIDLELNTNCTRIDRELVQLLNRFKTLQIKPSLDGVGKVFEYIRYPARWDTVAQNVATLQHITAKAPFCVSPVVQAYNVLDLVPICRFCDELDMDFTLLNLIQTPEHLKVENLPLNVRRIAAKRLGDYAVEGCRPQFRDQVESLARYLVSPEIVPNAGLLRQFMLFSNDLDARHGQSMQEYLPELHKLIVDSGFAWTAETRYAQLEPARLAARERLHAWV